MAKKLLRTPRGIFLWPRVSGKPDTKYKPEGDWKVTLALTGKDAESLAATIDEARKVALLEHKKENPKLVAKKALKVADPPYKPEIDESGEETGRILFAFKRQASGISKKTGEAWSRQIALFDGTGKPIIGNPRAGTGTIGRVSYELYPWFTVKEGSGISLRLTAVQIITLVEFGGSAEYYGFDDESESTETALDAPATEEVPAGESTGDGDEF